MVGMACSRALETEDDAAWSGPAGRRRQRIFEGLRPLGDASHWWADACRLMADDRYRPRVHLTFHALRELDSALLEVLAPSVLLTEEQQIAVDRDVKRLGEVLTTAGFSADVFDRARTALPPNRAHRVRAISATLDLPKDVATVWAQLRTHRLAHRNALRLRVDDDEYDATLSEVELVLETLSERWKRRYPDWVERLDEIVGSPPGKGSVSAFLSSVPPIPTLWHHFFSRLEDPQWLLPLEKQNVFNILPIPKLSDDGRVIHFEAWPAALFLEKMAPGHPNEVAAILTQLPASTNPLVHNAVIHVASNLPAEPATTVAPRIADGVSSWQGQLPPLDRLEALLTLVCSAESGVGLDLAGRILAIRPPEQAWMAATTVTGLTADAYRQLAGVVASGLRSVSATLRLGVFMRAAASADPDGGLVGQVPDFDQPSRFHRDPRVALALVLASETERALEDGDVGAIEYLLGTGRSLAVRVAVQAVRRHGNPELASRTIEDRRVLDVQQAYWEVGKLVRDRFPELTAEARKSYLSWIVAGPTGTLDPGDAVRWRGLRLQPVAPHLEGEERSLLERWPPPEGDALALPQVRVRVGPKPSPWSAGELIDMPVDQLFDLLKAYDPGQDAEGSRLGVADALAQAVHRRVHLFLPRADVFVDLLPEYHHAFLVGMTGVLVPWVVVLRSSASALQRNDPPGPLVGESLEDPPRQLRFAVLHLLGRRSWQSDGDSLTDDDLPLLQMILHSCLTDPHPHGDEPWLDPRDWLHTPATVRNHAYEAAIRVIGHLARTRGATATRSVTTLLSSNLAQEQCPVVFAQVARSLGLLEEFAPDWVATNLELVLGPPGSDDRRHAAAWRAYAYSDPLAGSARRRLQPWFEAWANLLAAHSPEEPDVLHAGSLGTLIAAGEVDGELANHFFAVAPLRLRAAALGAAAPTTSEAATRSMTLWDSRQEAVLNGSDPIELIAVTSWVSNEHLSPGWRLTALKQALRSDARIRDPRRLMAYLGVIVAAHGEFDLDVLECLELLIPSAETRHLDGEMIIGLLRSIYRRSPESRQRVREVASTAAAHLYDPSLIGRATAEQPS